jgi:hypothetical protein
MEEWSSGDSDTQEWSSGEDESSRRPDETEHSQSWQTDDKFPFDPPIFTLAHEQMVRDAAQTSMHIPSYSYTYQLLQDFGQQCAHDRAAWNGHNVGQRQDDVELWNNFSKLDVHLAPLLQEMAITMSAVHIMWSQIMAITPYKCPQAEQILTDRREFWVLLGLLAVIEQAYWN